MHKLNPAGTALAIALSLPLAAQAQAQATPSGGADIQALRQEIDAIRSAYEARLQALEQRLKAAEETAAQTAAQAAAAAPAAAPVAIAAPPAADGGGNKNAFNPALSLILSGLYTRSSKDPSTYAIAGIPLPPDATIGPGTRGFSLAESELGIAASIDPWLRGSANISLHPDDTVSVEEAYVQTTSLGSGFGIKAGRFFSSVGYLNSQHSHTWDFVDNPLAYQALLGTQYGDDGVQASWIAPIDQYLEVAVELGRGRSFPGGDNGLNGAGSAAVAVHLGDDVGDSGSWRAGLSVLNAKAADQRLASTDFAGNAVASAFSGRTRVWVADATWKWAPNGNATRTNFKLQGEYLRSTRDGSLVVDPDGAALAGGYRAVQSGWYLQGIYQFVPHWRVGLRAERLDPGSPELAAHTTALAGDGLRPGKQSLMVDFSPSEFSRVRLQFARDKANPASPDNQIFLQYQMSLGAHGAHSY